LKLLTIKKSCSNFDLVKPSLFLDGYKEIDPAGIYGGIVLKSETLAGPCVGVEPYKIHKWIVEVDEETTKFFEMNS